MWGGGVYKEIYLFLHWTGLKRLGKVWNKLKKNRRKNCQIVGKSFEKKFVKVEQSRWNIDKFNEVWKGFEKYYKSWRRKVGEQTVGIIWDHLACHHHHTPRWLQVSLTN